MKPIIRVKNISKTFKIPLEPVKTLKGRFINPFRGRAYETFHALKDVSFDVMPGEWVGIIGRNGSGKSTLLKIIAGIYAPDKGRVKIRGRMVPFLELGVGFNPELSARENIFLNGVILGMSRKEIKEKFNDIISFSGIKKFINQKLKNFSSGMQIRLAFAVAKEARGDIYLLDEILAVGDAGFQRKCSDVFRQFKKEGKTILFVSHDMKKIEDNCDRVILMEEGEKIMEGKFEKIITRYSNIINSRINKDGDIPINNGIDICNTAEKKAEITDIKLFNAENEETYSLNSGESCSIKVSLKALSSLDDITISCNFINEKEISLAFIRETIKGIDIKKNDNFDIILTQKMSFTSNQLKLMINTGPEDMSPTHFYDNNFIGKGPLYFSIVNSKNNIGLVDLKTKIEIKKEVTCRVLY